MTVRVWKRIQLHTQKLREKRGLYTVLDSEYNSKLLVKYFKRLQRYKKYRKRKSLKDQDLRQGIYEIRKGFMLRYWQRLMKQRQALQWIQYVTDVSRSRKVFQNLSKYSTFQQEIFRVICLNRDPYLQLQVIGALRKYINKKKTCQRNIPHQRQRCLYHVKFRAFKKMTDSYNLAQEHKFIIKNYAMRKHFRILQSHCKNEKLKKYAILFHDQKLSSKSFKTIRRFVKTVKTGQHLQ